MAEIMEVTLSSVNLSNILSHHRIIETDYDHDHGGHYSQESHVICPTKSKVSCNLKNSFENQNICIGGPPKKFWRP